MLFANGLVDLAQRILRHEFIEAKAASHVQINPAWNEDLRVDIALGDALDAIGEAEQADHIDLAQRVRCACGTRDERPLPRQLSNGQFSVEQC